MNTRFRIFLRLVQSPTSKVQSRGFSGKRRGFRLWTLDLGPSTRTPMYFLKRLVLSVPLLLLISALVRVAPGGPFDRERKPASPEIERALLAKYHLDEPGWKQYLRFLADLGRGDFGL